MSYIRTLLFALLLASAAFCYNATGGSITTIMDDGINYTIHTFTSNSSFNVTGEINATVLVVAGGGAGGYTTAGNGGGGGAGGLLYNTSYNATGNITVVVGNGGICGAGSSTSGQNSSFGSMVSVGGGYGGHWTGSESGVLGGNGGSGGGTAQATNTQGTANGTAGQGNNGGYYIGGGVSYSGGGGGGAGEVGQNSTTTGGGWGGNGTNYSINGTSICYAGGGGGSTHSSKAIQAGGGCQNLSGGKGARNTGGQASTPGVNGTGGGGGGGGEGTQGSNGGTGIVIVRYVTDIPDITVSWVDFTPDNNTNDFTYGLSFNMSVNMTEGVISNDSYIEVDGVNHTCAIQQNNGSNWCYQEFANVSTACGGLSSGTYDSSDPLFIDGDWGTSASDPILYINYSKPANAMGAIATMKIVGVQNYTIPASCFSQTQLQILYNKSVGIIYGLCQNGTDWEIFRTGIPGETGFAEEAIWWNISNINISSCYYELSYAEHLFNHTYTVKGFANVSGTYYQANETRYVPYYGCGVVSSNGTMLGNANMPVAAAGASGCMNISASDITFDCAYYNITTSAATGVSGIYGEGVANTTITGCEIIPDNAGIYLNSVVGYNDISDTNITNSTYAVYATGDYYSTNISLYDVRSENNVINAFDLTGFGYAYGEYVWANSSLFGGLSIADTVLADILLTTINNTLTYGMEFEGDSQVNVGTSTSENAVNALIWTDSPLNLTSSNLSGSADDGLYSFAPVNISDVEISNTTEYGIWMDNGIAATDLVAYNLLVHDAGTTCVHSDAGFDVGISNATIYNCTSSGIIFDGDGFFQLNETRIFNTSASGITISGFSGPVFALFNNVTFDRPEGNWTDYTSIDMLDLLDMDGYSMNWSQNSSPAPGGFSVFSGKLINMSSNGPVPSVVEAISFRWNDSELGSANESKFALFKYNSTAGWMMLNNTPDTTGDTLNYENLVLASDFGILEGEITAWFVDPTPQNNTNHFDFPMIFNYSTSLPMDLLGNLMEIDGVNYSCTLSGDMQSCWYIMNYDEHVYNHTYNVTGWPSIWGSPIPTNETRVVPYLGCGNVTASDILINNTLNPDANYPNCFRFVANDIDFDCAGYDVNSTFGVSFINNLQDNLTVHDCNVYDGYSLVSPEGNITIDGDYVTFRNFGFYINSGFTVYSADNATIDGARSLSGGAVPFFMAEDNYNLSVNNLTDAYGDMDQEFSPGGNAIITNSDFDQGGLWSIGVGNYINLTIINTTFVNRDFAGYQDDIHLSLDATNISVHDSGQGLIMYSDTDDPFPSYYKLADGIHFYNNTVFNYFASGGMNAGTIYILRNMLVDANDGLLANFTNISQVLYLGGFMMDGTCQMNRTEGIAAPAGYTQVGQLLNFSCSGIEGTEFNWTWTDAQTAGLNDSYFILARYNGTAWVTQNNTPDTTDNLMWLGYADPWQAGVYGLFESSVPTNLYGQLLSPANGSVFRTPVNLTWKCYGDFTAYTSVATISNFTGAPGVMPSLNNTNVSDNFGFTLLDDAYHFWNVTCANGTNTNASGTGYFITDFGGPNITINTPLNASYTTASILVNLTVTDNYSSVDRIWFSNGSGANVTYTIPVVRTFAQGSTTLVVWANDTLGNNATANVTFYVDTVSPVITINSPLNATYDTNTITVNLTVTDADLDTVWFWNGTDNETYTAVTSVDYSDGSHNLTAWANDTIGHVTQASVIFLTDETDPTIAYQVYTDADGTQRIDWPTSWVAFNVAAGDATSGLKNLTTRIYKDGVLWHTVNSATSPVVRNYTITASGLYTFNATAYDNAGNRNDLASRSVNVTLYAGSTATITHPLSASATDHVTLVCSGAGPFNGSLFRDGAYINSTTCASDTSCNIYFPVTDCGVVTIIGQCEDSFGFFVNSTPVTYTIIPDYSLISSPADGVTVNNGTNLTFVMNWSCTPTSTDVVITPPALPFPMNCTGLVCSFTNDTWESGMHLWNIRTGLLSGGYVYSPSFNFMVPMTHWTVNSSVVFNNTYNYTNFVEFNVGFYEDYGAYILGILSYALAWVITQRYPQTLIAGGIGAFFVFLVTGNVAILTMSVLTVIVGMAYKYAVG